MQQKKLQKNSKGFLAVSETETSGEELLQAEGGKNKNRTKSNKKN